MHNVTELTAGATAIGVLDGTPIKRITKFAPSLTPASVAAATVASQNFTVTGVRTTDVLFVSGPALSNSSYVVAARVNTNDQVALIFCNPTAGALTPVAGVYNIVAVEF